LECGGGNSGGRRHITRIGCGWGGDGEVEISNPQKKIPKSTAHQYNRFRYFPVKILEKHSTIFTLSAKEAYI